MKGDGYLAPVGMPAVFVNAPVFHSGHAVESGLTFSFGRESSRGDSERENKPGTGQSLCGPSTYIDVPGEDLFCHGWGAVKPEIEYDEELGPSKKSNRRYLMERNSSKYTQTKEVEMGRVMQ